MLVSTLEWLMGVLILGVEPIRTTVGVVTYITIAGAFASMFGAIVAASFGLMQGPVFAIYRLTNLLTLVSFSSPCMRALQQLPIQNPKSEIQNESSSSRLG